MEDIAAIPQRPAEENQRIKTSLLVLGDLGQEFEGRFCIFGSIIPAALLGRPQRKLGDIDLILDEGIKDAFLRKVARERFKVNAHHFRLLGLKIEVIEVEAQDKLGLTIFPGRFDEEGNFILGLSKNFRIVVPAEMIKPTSYTLFGISFEGVPATTGYKGAFRSRRNPKRKYDLAVFEAKLGKIDFGEVADIKVFYKTIELPWLYSLGTYLQNLLGSIFLFFGKNYDFWKDLGLGGG